MVELAILTDSRRGDIHRVGRFPCTVGRTDADLIIEAPGVWNRHFTIRQAEDSRFQIQAESPAAVTVGDQPVAEAILRNGDVIGLGGVRLQFRIAPATGRNLVPQARLLWLLLTAVVAGELLLFCLV